MVLGKKLVALLWVFSCAICIGIGWILAGDPEGGTVEVVRVDTLRVETSRIDTIVQTDTVQSAPKIKYVPVRDTIHDSIFVAEKVREYDASTTFEDSCFIRHGFDIRVRDNILVANRWEYRPPPPIEVMVEKKVYPGKVEKAIKTVGWVAAASGLTAAIINNSK